MRSTPSFHFSLSTFHIIESTSEGVIEIAAYRFTINGVSLLNYLAEDGIKWTRFDVEAPDLSGLANTIAQAIAEISNRPQPEQSIRVYLDGRQLSDAVTRYQRRENRANGG